MSKKIIVPFSDEMAMAALESKKVVTTRSEKKGEPGDWFYINYPEPYLDEPKAFRIIDIFPVDLQEVKNRYFILEGFESAESFERTWRKLHRGHFTTNKTYYIHFFARLD